MCRVYESAIAQGALRRLVDEGKKIVEAGRELAARTDSALEAAADTGNPALKRLAIMQSIIAYDALRSAEATHARAVTESIMMAERGNR